MRGKRRPRWTSITVPLSSRRTDRARVIVLPTRTRVCRRAACGRWDMRESHGSRASTLPTASPLTVGFCHPEEGRRGISRGSVRFRVTFGSRWPATVERSSGAEWPSRDPSFLVMTGCGRRGWLVGRLGLATHRPKTCGHSEVGRRGISRWSLAARIPCCDRRPAVRGRFGWSANCVAGFPATLQDACRARGRGGRAACWPRRRR